jgi:hypothetical protein
MDIKHLGRPVQFGGEKEFNLKSLKGGNEYLQHTQAPAGWNPGLLGQVTGDMVKPGVKLDGQIQWADLNDKGKAQYALAFKARNNNFPVIKTTPNPDYSEIAWEKNGWIEVVSKPFDLEGIQKFLNNYGWGHIHTSFMRGAPKAEQKQMLSWVQNANLYSFLNSLENRSFEVNGDAGWRFCIVGLSIPTVQHLERYERIFGGENLQATAFAKHTIINVRGNGKQYGDPNRIGMETRGGSQDEKVRMLNSLLGGLQGNGWGAHPMAPGDSAFRLPDVRETGIKSPKYGQYQVKKLPQDFKNLIVEHLRAHPQAGITEADAQRMFDFVNRGQFFPTEVAARLQSFDQRACVPLLKYEALPWLSDADKARAVEARSWFIGQLNELSKQNLNPRDTAIQSAQLMTDWGKHAKLADAFGKWLDGPNPQQYLR